MAVEHVLMSKQIVQIISFIQPCFLRLVHIFMQNSVTNLLVLSTCISNWKNHDIVQ